MGHGTKKILDTYHKLYPQQVNIGEHNHINLYRSGDEMQIKKLMFKPIHVEHSTPGAYGTIIETKQGSIIYTGDFRRHGPKKEYTDEFIQKARKSRPYALLCEGTRMTPDKEKQYTEEQVYKKGKGNNRRQQGSCFRRVFDD